MRESAEILEDLTLVGKTKSMGYLPIKTLIEHCGSSVEAMNEYASSNNLECIVYENGDTRISSGAVYLYDKEMLEKQLRTYKDILNDANVSISPPEEFIYYISCHTVEREKHPKAYVAVGKMFNDIRFRCVSAFEATINTKWKLQEFL